MNSHYDTVVVSILFNGCLNFPQPKTVSALDPWKSSLDPWKSSLKTWWHSNRVYGVRNQFTCSHFNRKWIFAQHFFELYSFHALGSARTLTAITRQHVAYFLKAALLNCSSWATKHANIGNNLVFE